MESLNEEIFQDNETPTTEAERKLAYYQMVLRCDVGHNGVSEQDKIDAEKYFSEQTGMHSASKDPLFR